MRQIARQKMKREKTDFSSKIRALREVTGMNQVSFANDLGVARSLLAACEGDSRKPSTREPSTDLLVRLGNVAAKALRYDDANWFWEKAGLNRDSLDSLLSERLRQKSAPISEFIFIASIDPDDSETIPFPSHLLTDAPSTRFMRLPDSMPPFGRSDLVLVLTKAPSVLELEDGDLLLVGISKTPWKLFGSEIGTLTREQVSTDGPRVHFSIEKFHGGGMLVAMSEKPGHLQVLTPVLGKVVSWVHATGDASIYRHWDRAGVIASAEISKESSRVKSKSVKKGKKS